MQTNSYRLTLFAVSAALVVVIAALSFVLYSRGPRVRLVAFERDPQATALHLNSLVTITFDRPIEDEDYTNAISFTPEIAFETQTSTQSIVVTLKQNLRHNTEYRLQIEPEIVDQTGRRMRGSHDHSFTVGAPRYSYIERNYGFDLSADTTFLAPDADDHVKLARLGNEPEVVFSHPEIITFAANSEYLVTAIKDEQTDQLVTVNLVTRATRTEHLQFDGRINSLVLSPHGSQALFSVTQEPGSQTQPDDLTRLANRVESLNLETGEILSLKDADGDYIRSFSIQLDPSGQTALVQDEAQTFYAVSPFNDYDPILIGTQADSFGFSGDSREIVFRNNEVFSRYNVATGNSVAQDFATTSYIRDVSNGVGGVYFSSVGLQNGRHYLERVRDWTDAEPELVWSNVENTDVLMQDFSVSHDGSTFALQLNPDGCTFDSFGVHSQCTAARTVIYDSSPAEELTSFPGFDLVWLP